MQIFDEMTQDQFGQTIYSESDLIDAVMSGRDITEIQNLVVESKIDLSLLNATTQNRCIATWRHPESRDITVQEYDIINQAQWHMPEPYRSMDIAAHVLDLCDGAAELQRAGQELLMFQERGLFDLLRYLTYLVSVMRDNHIVWGVGRGSSVASFVLYKLGVHRINSLYYDLDPGQFLR